MPLDPVAVALKFGFLAVLYLFLLWMARSALRDLRAGGASRTAAPARRLRGRHRHARRLRRARRRRATAGAPKLRVETAAGLRAGSAYDLSDGALLGRGDRRTSASRTPSPRRGTRGWSPQGDVIVLEDLGSTNGTYLNGEPLRGPQPLHVGDRIRIGDSEFTFER